MNADVLATHPTYLDMMFRLKTCESVLEDQGNASQSIASILFYQVWFCFDAALVCAYPSYANVGTLIPNP